VGTYSQGKSSRPIASGRREINKPVRLLLVLDNWIYNYRIWPIHNTPTTLVTGHEPERAAAVPKHAVDDASLILMVSEHEKPSTTVKKPPPSTPLRATYVASVLLRTGGELNLLAAIPLHGPDSSVSCSSSHSPLPPLPPLPPWLLIGGTAHTRHAAHRSNCRCSLLPSAYCVAGSTPRSCRHVRPWWSRATLTLRSSSPTASWSSPTPSSWLPTSSLHL
jgi:hypothetical protein